MQPRRKSKRPLAVLLILIAAFAIGGIGWLTTLEIPSQQERVERELPAEQFLKNSDARV